MDVLHPALLGRFFCGALAVRAAIPQTKAMGPADVR